VFRHCCTDNALRCIEAELAFLQREKAAHLVSWKSFAALEFQTVAAVEHQQLRTTVLNA
jgi:hypothetical protein